MKAFRFRLESVLTLREQAEQAAQQNCARAYAAAEAAAAEVRSAERAIEAAEQAQRAQLAGGSRAGELEHLRAYTVLLQECKRELECALAKARRQAEAAWQQLLVATQQRESLERVRSRQHRAHAYETARAEQRTLDECVGRNPALKGTWRKGSTDL